MDAPPIAIAAFCLGGRGLPSKNGGRPRQSSNNLQTAK